jgi:hypothetical protein
MKVFLMGMAIAVAVVGGALLDCGGKRQDVFHRGRSSELAVRCDSL